MLYINYLFYKLFSVTDIQLEILSIQLPEYAELRSPAYRLLRILDPLSQQVTGLTCYPIDIL